MASGVPILVVKERLKRIFNDDAAFHSAQTPFPSVTRKTSIERHLLNKEEHEENYNTTTESDKNGFDEWWSKQKQLKNRIQKTCKKFGPSLRKNIKRNELMYDPRHELLFCRNAKVSVYSSIHNTQIIQS